MKFSDLDIGDKFESEGLTYIKIYDNERFNNAVCSQTLTGIRRVPCRIPEDCEVIKLVD